MARQGRNRQPASPRVVGASRSGRSRRSRVDYRAHAALRRQPGRSTVVGRVLFVLSRPPPTSGLRSSRMLLTPIVFNAHPSLNLILHKQNAHCDQRHGRPPPPCLLRPGTKRAYQTVRWSETRSLGPELRIYITARRMRFSLRTPTKCKLHLNSTSSKSILLVTMNERGRPAARHILVLNFNGLGLACRVQNAAPVTALSMMPRQYATTGPMRHAIHVQRSVSVNKMSAYQAQFNPSASSRIRFGRDVESRRVDAEQYPRQIALDPLSVGSAHYDGGADWCPGASAHP